MDGEGGGGSCGETDSVFCDRCRASSRQGATMVVKEDEE